MLQLEVVIRGVFEPRRLLDWLHLFIVFERDGHTVIKKLAGYHQFHAVGRALDATLEASRPDDTRHVGVVWQTQGSGKSLTMACYAGRMVLHRRWKTRPSSSSPIAVTSTRNCSPRSRAAKISCASVPKANDRAQLRELLSVAAGGIVFTNRSEVLPEMRGDTLPLLSERRNIVVLADEAHRSQYDFIDGLARHMRDALPNRRS